TGTDRWTPPAWSAQRPSAFPQKSYRPCVFLSHAVLPFIMRSAIRLFLISLVVFYRNTILGGNGFVNWKSMKKLRKNTEKPLLAVSFRQMAVPGRISAAYRSCHTKRMAL